MDRREFLRRFGLGTAAATAGVLVAPTLAETLLIGARKYFFLWGNRFSELAEVRSPLEVAVEAIELERFMRDIPDLIPRDSSVYAAFRRQAVSIDRA